MGKKKDIGMINIAICDNDRAAAGIVEEMLRKIAIKECISINCEVFFNGEDLLTAVKGQGMQFELLYIAIMMCGMDGVHTVQALRRMELPVLTVYMSECDNYSNMEELINTETFRFLRKPVEEKSFCVFFLDACERIREESKYFTFFFKKAFYKVPFSRIMYFESNNRVISLHVDRGDSDITVNRFYAKMNEIDKQIREINGRFLRIHQSYLVNVDYVKTYTYTDITLIDGKRLKISENRKKNVWQCFGRLNGEIGSGMEEGRPGI